MRRFSLLCEATDLLVFSTGLSFLIGVTGFLVLRYEELIRVLVNGG